MSYILLTNEQNEQKMNQLCIKSTLVTSVFFLNFELMKFCQNFVDTFGKFWESFVAPTCPPKKHVRNCMYCTVHNLLYAEIVIIPLDILSSAEYPILQILTKLSRESFVKFPETFAWNFDESFVAATLLVTNRLYWNKCLFCLTEYPWPDQIFKYSKLSKTGKVCNPKS